MARACSDYIDSLTGYAIKTFIERNVGEIGGGFFTKNPDFFAFVIIIVYLVFMSFGVHATSWLNNVLCIINMFVLILITGVGIYFADLKNWEPVDGKSK